MKNNAIILAIILLGASALGYNAWYKKQLQQAPTGASNDQPLATEVEPAQRRPEFTLKDMIGLPRQLSEWDGHIIVLNFWATWCRPCLQEIPMFNDVQRQMKHNGVRFIGIAIDDRATIETFLERTGIEIDYTILVGDDDAIPVAVDYGNSTGILPYTVIIDTQGYITFHHYGAISREKLESELNSVIKQGA